MNDNMDLYELLESLDTGVVEMELTQEEVTEYLPRLLERCGISQETEKSTSGISGATVEAAAKKRLRPIYLIAAVIATLGLMGAGYATSVYLERLAYSGGSVTEEERDYDLYRDNPEALIDPPAFEDGNTSASNSESVIELELLGRQHLESVFTGRKPGEVFDVEIHGPDNKLKAHGLTGNSLNVLFSITERGYPSSDLLLNRENAPSTKQVVDQIAADDGFIVSIDDSNYTAQTLTYGYDELDELRYLDREGRVVQLFFSSDMGKIPLFQEDYEIAEELTINGNTFILIDKEEDCWAYLYLGEYDDVYYTSLSIFYQYGGREQILDVMKHLVVHNKEANNKTYNRQAFFESHPHDLIKTSASAIANALEKPVENTNGSGEAIPVLEQDIFRVEKWAKTSYFTIEVKENFQKDSPMYPYSRHTVLPDQSWFPNKQFTSVTAFYDGSRLLDTTYASADGRYRFSSQIIDNRYALTPLDAIIAKLSERGGYVETKILKAIDPTSDAPIVTVLSGETATIFSAVEIQNQFLVQSLFIPIEDLPVEWNS